MDYGDTDIQSAYTDPSKNNSDREFWKGAFQKFDAQNRRLDAEVDFAELIMDE